MKFRGYRMHQIGSKLKKQMKQVFQSVVLKWTLQKKKKGIIFSILLQM